VVSRDRHFANGYDVIRKPEKKVFVLKVAALSTVQTGRSLRLTGRRFYDCVPSTKEHGESRTSCGSIGWRGWWRRRRLTFEASNEKRRVRRHSQRTRCGRWLARKLLAPQSESADGKALLATEAPGTNAARLPCRHHLPPERLALAGATCARLHSSSVDRVVVHRITPITTMAKPSHRARGRSRRVALTDTYSLPRNPCPAWCEIRSLDCQSPPRGLPPGLLAVKTMADGDDPGRVEIGLPSSWA
jgi:hypothetical protein